MANRFWNEYQKTIADDHYFYERSCIRQTFFPGSETAFLRMLREELGKDIFDDFRQHTCTGIGYHTDVVPLETTMTVVARLFSLMTEHGYENYVPSCVTSFGVFTEMVHTWQERPDLLEKTRENLYKACKREFNLPKNIAHPSDVIYHFRFELAEKMKYRLVNAGMIEAWGGEVVDYPERRHCCGFGFRQYLVQENRGYSVSNTKKKLESMEPYEPDFIVSNCPGCSMFLDRWQYTIAEMEHKTYDREGYGIPVLTYEEMAGLLLGYDPWELGLQIHQVQAERLLDKIGIPYNPKDKYKSADGKILRAPEKPENLLV